MNASPTAAYVQRPGLHAVEMDGELVMMGLEQGEYYGLREVAASIWQHLAAPRTTEELCALVAEEYDVTAAACRDDVAAFLGELVDKALVDRVAEDG
jgi:hypothetical protein